MTTHATRNWHALPVSFEAIIRSPKGDYAKHTVIAFAFERDQVLWLTIDGEVVAPDPEARIGEKLDKSVWNGT